MCLIGLILGIISKAIWKIEIEKRQVYNVHRVLEKTDLLILIG